MDISEVMELLREAVGVAIKLAGPMLVLSMLVGVVVAIFQAVTQIHEQTLSFILKLAVVIGVLLIGGSWMLTTLQDYTKELLALIAG
jgi:flagellar biosynthetic protein FliQ